MKSVVTQFLDYLRLERNRSSHTVRNYGQDLEHFCDYCAEQDQQLGWGDVDSDLVRGWMEDMMDKGNTATSINRRLSSLRTFYKFAMARDIVTKDPVFHLRGPKRAKPLPQYLREEEMNRLLDDTEWSDSYEDMRDRAIILTFYSTGVRLSELTSMNESSVDFRNRQIRVIGKRNKERIIPFGQELYDELQKLINSEFRKVCVEPNSPLFTDAKGRRLTDAKVREIVKRHLSKVTTLKKKSPHVLRHTFATAMLNNDSELESIKELLRHASVSTTESYTHTTFDQLRKVYEKAHPRGEEG